MSVSVGSILGRKTIRMHVSTGGPTWAQFAFPIFYSGGPVLTMGFNATFEEPSATPSATLYYGFVSGPNHWLDSSSTDLFCGCRAILSYDAAGKRYLATSSNINYMYKIGATWYTIANGTKTHYAATAGRVGNPHWGATFGFKRRATGSNWSGYFPAGDWVSVRNETRDYKLGERFLTALSTFYSTLIKVPWDIINFTTVDNVSSSTNPEIVSGKTLDRVYVGLQASVGSVALHIFNIGFQEGRYETLSGGT